MKYFKFIITLKMLFLRWALLSVFLSVSLQAVAQTVSINEVMASNSVTITDQDGDFEDWIELYNYGSIPVNLEGFGLSDDYGNPFRWVFPDVTVEPGEFLLIWASGKDRRPDGGWVNGLMREVYTGITGQTIGDLINHPDYPDNPSTRQLWTGGFEAPNNIGNHYGQRMMGFIEAPASGDYVFWIASDDNGKLLLSSDEDPDNLVEIASVPGWTNPRGGIMTCCPNTPIYMVGTPGSLKIRSLRQGTMSVTGSLEGDNFPMILWQAG